MNRRGLGRGGAANQMSLPNLACLALRSACPIGAGEKRPIETQKIEDQKRPKANEDDDEDESYSPEKHADKIHQEALQLYNSMTPKERSEYLRMHGNVECGGRDREYELECIIEYFEEWGVPDPNDQDEDDEDDEGDERDIKLLVLDFDFVLTQAMYKLGDNPLVKGVTSQSDAFRTMTNEQHMLNFGGENVVKRIKKLFKDLKELNIRIRILSEGPRYQILKALRAIGALKYFTDTSTGSEVFGSKLFYDEYVTKYDIMVDWMKELNLKYGEVAFVDANRFNISEPAKGDNDRGLAQILGAPHVHLNEGAFVGDTLQWIKDICGLTEPEE